MKADAKISDLKGGEEIFTIPVGGICLQLQPFGIVNPAGHTHLTEGILSEAMDDVAHRDAQAIINMEASFAKPKHWRIRRENSFRGPEARRRARAFPEANAAVTLMDGIIDKLRKTPGYKALYSMHGRQEFDFGDEPLKLIISQNFTAPWDMPVALMQHDINKACADTIQENPSLSAYVGDFKRSGSQQQRHER